MKKKKMIINNKQISFFDENSNEKNILLCIHGFAESKERYIDLIRYLSKGYRIIVVDLPGHGSSDKTDESSLQSLADTIYSKIKGLNIKNINILGFNGRTNRYTTHPSAS